MFVFVWFISYSCCCFLVSVKEAQNSLLHVLLRWLEVYRLLVRDWSLFFCNISKTVILLVNIKTSEQRVQTVRISWLLITNVSSNGRLRWTISCILWWRRWWVDWWLRNIANHIVETNMPLLHWDIENWIEILNITFNIIVGDIGRWMIGSAVSHTLIKIKSFLILFMPSMKTISN